MSWQSLKDKGNRAFCAGEYVCAEALYSKAIIADPKNASLYTNRAMARLKMSLWDSVIADCTACLALSPSNIKAHYYLAQAHLGLHSHSSALEHALRAHSLCVQTADKSLSLLTSLVLRCKKEQWDEVDKSRRRDGQELEGVVVQLMEKEREREAGESEEDMQDEVRGEWERRMKGVREVFERAREKSEKRRKVPDWAVDDISFGIMVDPVITKTGKSYERSSILEHLKHHQTDPLTREPLLPHELRSNLDLRDACSDFLEENGWAVEW